MFNLASDSRVPYGITSSPEMVEDEEDGEMLLEAEEDDEKLLNRASDQALTIE